jgi:hypothetical protein
MSGTHAGAQPNKPCLVERPHVCPTEDFVCAKLIKKQLQMEHKYLKGRRKKMNCLIFTDGLQLEKTEKSKSNFEKHVDKPSTLIAGQAFSPER